MGTMFGNFEIGRKSLLAQQLALQVTGNNIANVNTPGYSRQKVVMEPSLPIQTSIGQIGTGVDVKSISSVRDRFVEIRLSQGIQTKRQEEAALGVLEQVQAAFSVDDAGIRDGITEFFNSFSKLASNPESVPLRNSVITQAQNLTSAFKSSARHLIDIRHSVNSQVSGVVNQVNSLADSIKQINLSIVSAESGGADAAALRDQRGELINQLSELVDVSYYEAQDGTLSVSIAGGHTLVTAGFVHPLEAVSTPPEGMFHVMSGLNDLTNSISKGKLAGLIETRDTAIPAYQNDLDDLAAQIITSVNDQHRLGIDLDGNVGEDFFTPVAPGTSAALTISLNLNVTTNARKIAASQTDPLPTIPVPTANPGHSGAPGDELQRPSSRKSRSSKACRRRQGDLL